MSNFIASFAKKIIIVAFYTPINNVNTVNATSDLYSMYCLNTVRLTMEFHFIRFIRNVQYGKKLQKSNKQS